MNDDQINEFKKIFTVKRIITGVVALVLLFVIYWVYSHSFIQVKVVSGSNGNKIASYEYKNQKSGKKYEIKTSVGESKKLVPSGSYEVRVVGGDKNYFSVVKAGHFLTSSKISATLQSEKSRTFVGNNPGPCMYYTGEVLYSTSCNGEFQDLTVHLPASAQSASVVKNPLKGITYPVGGFIKLGGKDLAMVKVSDTEDVVGTGLYPLNTNLTVGGGTTLKGQNLSTTYKMQPFQSGFIAYDTSIRDVSYYKDVNSKPERIINNIKIDDDSLVATSVSAHGDRVAIVFTEKSAEQNLDAPSAGGKTVVQIFNYKSRQTKTYTFGDRYASVKLCGTNQLCLVNGRVLEVYDVSGKSQKKMYEVTDVRAIENDGNTLVVITNESVIGLDVATASGAVQYSFGDYEFCNSGQAGSGGYVLCLTNLHEDRMAVYINTSEDNTDSIDKKVLDIYDSPAVDNISAYKNIIYISPDLGKVQYNPAIKGYSYDPDRIKDTTRRINDAVSKSGLDTSKYVVINPYAGL